MVRACVFKPVVAQVGLRVPTPLLNAGAQSVLLRVSGQASGVLQSYMVLVSEVALRGPGFARGA